MIHSHESFKIFAQRPVTSCIVTDTINNNIKRLVFRNLLFLSAHSFCCKGAINPIQIIEGIRENLGIKSNATPSLHLSLKVNEIVFSIKRFL